MEASGGPRPATAARARQWIAGATCFPEGATARDAARLGAYASAAAQGTHATLEAVDPSLQLVDLPLPLPQRAAQFGNLTTAAA